MQFDSLIIWSLLGAGCLFMTILCVSFSRLLNLLLRPKAHLKTNQVVIVKDSEPVSNVGPIKTND